MLNKKRMTRSKMVCSRNQQEEVTTEMMCQFPFQSLHVTMAQDELRLKFATLISRLLSSLVIFLVQGLFGLMGSIMYGPFFNPVWALFLVRGSWTNDICNKTSDCMNPAHPYIFVAIKQFLCIVVANVPVIIGYCHFKDTLKIFKP